MEELLEQLVIIHGCSITLDMAVAVKLDSLVSIRTLELRLVAELE